MMEAKIVSNFNAMKTARRVFQNDYDKELVIISDTWLLNAFYCHRWICTVHPLQEFFFPLLTFEFLENNKTIVKTNLIFCLVIIKFE